MLSPHKLYTGLRKQGICLFAGVPDSLLKEFCAYLMNELDSQSHVVAANEGGAVGLAAGHYLATGNPALVYMQNSGQGNAINPLLSLADPEVYGIPMLLLVGWRGEPGVKDEPQHLKQGRVMKSLFDAMEIPNEVLTSCMEDVDAQIDRVLGMARKKHCPVALIVRKGTLSQYNNRIHSENRYSLHREEMVDRIASLIPRDAIVIGTTGHISRELYEYRIRHGGEHAQDFLTVGSMGHASQIALGIAMAQPKRTVYCLDGDGALLMHMGAMPLIGKSGCLNMRHVVLNNGAHVSVGGQPTLAFHISLSNIAREVGYVSAHTASTLEEFEKAWEIFNQNHGPSFLEVRVSTRVRDDLGRPKTTPAQNKAAFMQFLELEI